jgi:pimeloyl-ACP methyl ester carboxylesterase
MPEALRLAYEEGGEGLPVLLLHGFPLHRDIFAPVLPAASQLARVVALDLPGFGASPLPAEGFSMQSLAREVLAFARGKGFRRFALVGHSMGGYVALEVASQAPEALAGLVLLASHPRADTPEARARRAEGVALIRSGLRQEFLAGFLSRLLSRWSQQNAPRLAAELAAMAQAVPDEVLVGCLEAMAARADHTVTLTRLQVPVLVLIGEEDALITRELAESAAQAATRGELVVIPEAGHVPTMEKPIATAEALARFLRALER